MQMFLFKPFLSTGQKKGVERMGTRRTRILRIYADFFWSLC
jgi:hypothetical protein